MDFWRTILVLLRRWYVALPALALSLLVSGMVFQSIPPKYQATGSIVLTSPNSGSGDAGKTVKTNPLLSFDGSLEVSAQLLTQVLASPQVNKELVQQGATGEYQVDAAGGPFVAVIATGRSAVEAQRTVLLVLSRARTELIDRQNDLGAPRALYINIKDVVRPTVAVKQIGGKMRGAGAALALGLAASLGSAFMIQSFLEYRRDRRGVPRASGRALVRRPRSSAPATGPVPAPDLGQPVHTPRRESVAR